MTHALALIVLPPGEKDEAEDEVHDVLLPFSENYPTMEDYNPDGWWDYWRIDERFYPLACTPAEVIANADPDTGDMCWTIVAGETVLHKEIYHADRKFPDCFEPVEDFNGKVRKILESVHPESRIVTVDYHC